MRSVFAVVDFPRHLQGAFDIPKPRDWGPRFPRMHGQYFKSLRSCGLAPPSQESRQSCFRKTLINLPHCSSFRHGKISVELRCTTLFIRCHFVRNCDCVLRYHSVDLSRRAIIRLMQSEIPFSLSSDGRLSFVPFEGFFSTCQSPMNGGVPFLTSSLSLLANRSSACRSKFPPLLDVNAGAMSLPVS